MKPLTSRLIKKTEPFQSGTIPLKAILSAWNKVTTVPCMKGPRYALYPRAMSVRTQGNSSYKT